jgi:hypothetical protein
MNIEELNVLKRNLHSPLILYNYYGVEHIYNMFNIKIEVVDPNKTVKTITIVTRDESNAAEQPKSIRNQKAYYAANKVRINARRRELRKMRTDALNSKTRGIIKIPSISISNE